MDHAHQPERPQESGGTFPLRPYTQVQLAEFYGVSSRTLGRWIRPFEDEVGPKTGHYFTIAQVKMILQKLGVPGDMYID